jgi:hypothetical protein
MWHESVAFSVSQSCSPRRATCSVVLSHKLSTPPAYWPGESKFSSSQLSTQSSTKNTVESRNARCWVLPVREERKKSDKGQIWLFAAWEWITQKIPGNNEKKRYLGNENYKGLYWQDPTVNSCPKERPPGSPRTFSIVPCSRTSSLRAKQDRSNPFPLSIPPLSLLCSNRV